MSKKEEELLAGGKNYEHTSDAVHTSKLEILFKIMSRTATIRKKLKKGFPVSIVIVVVFLY
jgi:hypothetical protein